MKLHLEVVEEHGDVQVLRSKTPLPPSDEPRELRYRTRTGALMRVNGVACGAFDRIHDAVVVPPGTSGELTLEVERRSSPIDSLALGVALRWHHRPWRLAERPARRVEMLAPPPARPAPAAQSNGGLALVGHAHLDVAWLWTYDEARRKALRTFATAVRQLEADPAYVFTQSQPQLYAFVEEDDPELFERVARLAREGRFDASGAALWVEPDCNLPSGESLLRQLMFGMRYALERLGTAPSVAWLPDSFGFANTLPTLLAHAGVTGFSTTKHSWNDTTRFPHAQFLWEGPDGSRVLGAQLASIQGGFEPRRVERARSRRELLLVGYGDGGGGATDAMVAEGSTRGAWTGLGRWFEQLAARAGELPVVRGELYLEYHRGVFTTHHDVKARNAALERALAKAEQLGAWALALHASPLFLDEFRARLDEAWELVLRAQFHDVLPGTAIAPVYADAQTEYGRADSLVATAIESARAALPQSTLAREERFVAPRREVGGYRFANAALEARVLADGTLAELRVAGGPNLVVRANLLRAYADHPKQWDAWNLDRRYRRHPLVVRPDSCECFDDGLEIRYRVGAASLAVLRFALREDEALLRVDMAVGWRERHAILRCESELGIVNARARFGSPHGSLERPVRPRAPDEHAKFEACGQRFACVDGKAREGGAGAGVAMLVLDTYGWSLSGMRGGVRLGHSLLRAPTWPQRDADRGEHVVSYAFVPFGRSSLGELERIWERYALAPELAMFDCDDPSIFVVATKLADDGDGVVVRARECDGMPRQAALRCAARAREAACVDALERPLEGEAELRDGAIHVRFEPYQLRSFRVRLW
ncbi:MAG: alpha-mannosidase [Vulcanimicrobiaceae bacterium]